MKPFRAIFLAACCAAILPAAHCDGGPFFEQDVPLDIAFFSGVTVPPAAPGPITKNKKLTVGIGSGAWHSKGDEPGILYTITDRGPNIDTGDAQLENFLSMKIGSGSGKIFPVPNFSPSIYKLQVCLGQYTVLDIIQLKTAGGFPISGVSVPAIEQGFDGAGNKLPGDVNAIDSEALVRLKNGEFWIASEYGPDLIHVGADGRIIDRLVPLGASKVPGTGLFPEYYNARRLNRGFESIAISPDEKFLYTMIQSPLEQKVSGVNVGRNSRCLRFLKIDRAALSIVHEYIYEEQPITEFTLDYVAGSSSQGNVKVSEMVCLDTDKLLVLERETKTTKLFLVKLAGATATEGMSLDLIEKATDPVAVPGAPELPAGVTPVSKKLVFDGPTDFPGLVKKVEGIAWLGGGDFVLINDNDFSTEDEPPGTPAVTTLTRIFIPPHKLQ
ncbi:MAG TPA: esterase-like activity of phytase family protein [Planctomycetota bacterium]|nr:esterase-like activity of phytase family protein [Planctomycetota bacterium]